MACGCGGGGVSSPMHSSAAFARVVPGPEVYVVTFPDGRSKEFDSESEAYHAIRLTGGGIQRKPRA